MGKMEKKAWRRKAKYMGSERWQDSGLKINIHSDHWGKNG